MRKLKNYVFYLFRIVKIQSNRWKKGYYKGKNLQIVSFTWQLTEKSSWSFDERPSGHEIDILQCKLVSFAWKRT